MAKRDREKKPARPQRAIMDIDLANLEVEWQEQPKLYLAAAEELADAKKAAEELELELIVRKAEAEKEVRAEPEDFGLEKVTEAGVKAAVDTHKKVISLRSKIIEANHLVGLLVGKCRALEHRKRALEKEVDLFLAGYFAAPKEKRRNLSPAGGPRMPAGLRKRGRDDDDED